MDINDWRAKIDGLTDELIALLNKRASYAEEIGKIKKRQGLRRVMIYVRSYRKR